MWTTRRATVATAAQRCHRTVRTDPTTLVMMVTLAIRPTAARAANEQPNPVSWPTAVIPAPIPLGRLASHDASTATTTTVPAATPARCHITSGAVPTPSLFVR